MPHHSVIMATDSQNAAVCLFTGRWGCIVEDLGERTDDAWAWKLVKGSIHVMHLCHAEVHVVSVEGAAMQDATIALTATSPKYTLLECALKTRYCFNKWELIKASLAGFQPPSTLPILAALSFEALLHGLIEFVFKDDPASISQVKDLYAKERVVEEPELDEETCALIEEMAISDQVNSSDLKAYQDDSKKSQINALNRKRKQEEEKEQAKKKAK